MSISSLKCSGVFQIVMAGHNAVASICREKVFEDRYSNREDKATCLFSTGAEAVALI